MRCTKAAPWPTAEGKAFMPLGHAYKIWIVPFCIFWAAMVPANASDEEDWTVVTMARNGSWGVATDASMGRAIFVAIRDCRAMSTGQNDCGAEFTTIRRGWTLALLCGDQRILAAAKGLDEAGSAAALRVELKRAYLPNLLPCRRVLSVDPNGVIVAQAKD
jgi:hypothetical protein